MLDTRYGHVALVRLALLVLAIPLLRVPAAPAPAAEHPLRWWWIALGAGGRRRARGHARHRRPRVHRHPDRARDPGRPVHVAGMACWLGGLVVLCFAVAAPRNVRRAARGARRATPRSRWARSSRSSSRGAFQAWRQVGSIDALKSTDYGRLLIAKLVVFAALIVAAAFSREVVNRRFRALLPDDDEFVTADDPVLVGARRPARVRASRCGAVGGRAAASSTGGYCDDGGDETTTTGTTTPRTRRR